MSKEIVFESINVEDPAQKSRVQFESKIFNMVNGKQVYPDEETGFIFQKYSGFAPKKFNPDPSKRDFIKVALDPSKKSCMDLKEKLDMYDDSAEANRKVIFGKYDRLYKLIRSVKQPKKNDEEDLIDEDCDDVQENEPKESKETEPKFDNSKFKLKMDWFYYFENQRLDKANTNIVKKQISDLMTKNKNLDKDKKKALLGTLVFKLNFVEEDKTVQRNVAFTELEQRKEIDTKIFHRRPKTITSEGLEFLDSVRGLTEKEIIEYEQKLVSLFGDPGDFKDVRTPDDLDKYYGPRCYIRLLYTPFRLWAAKSKDPDADKRKAGIKYVVNSIDIIQLPYENNADSIQRIAYSKYGFGRTSVSAEQLLINQSVDTVFTSVSDKSVENTEKSVEKTVEKSDKKSTKNEKKQMKVESDSEESESEESESEESESEESESEPEPEPEPEPVKKGKSKTVVETSKSTKTTKSNRK